MQIQNFEAFMASKSTAGCKALIYFLYADLPYLLRHGEGVMEIIDMEKLAKIVGGNTTNVRHHLVTLSMFGLVTDLVFLKNRTTFKVKMPLV
jgi:hypothetical protein